jgi:hypothetical protein
VLATLLALGVCWSFWAVLTWLSSPSAAPPHRQAAENGPSFKTILALQKRLRGQVAAPAQPAVTGIHGYVLTAQGTPVERATVCSQAALERCCDDAPCVETDGAGRFDFPPLRAVGTSLVASASGHATLTQDIEWGPGGAAVSQEMRLEPALEQAASVRGSVRDVYGGPVSGAVVSMVRDLEQTRQGVSMSQADGSFALTVEGGSGLVCAHADAYARICQDTSAPSEGNTLVLMPASGIAGRVLVDGTGDGVAQATVRAINHDGMRVPVDPVRSDADGVFRFDALPPGGYSLTAISEHSRTTEVSVNLGVGETKQSIILTASPSVRFSAAVLLGNAPCPGAEVMLAGPVPAFGEVSSEGLVSLDGLPPGLYRASATCRGQRDAIALDIADHPFHHTWSFEASSETLVKSPEPEQPPAVRGGTIKVRLSNAEAADAPIRIFANAGSLMPLRARQSANEFIFDDLPNGEYRVHPFDDIEQARSVSIHRAGELVELQVALRERATIAGHIVDVRGAPVSEAWVSHSRDGVPEGDQMVGSPALADVNGAFILPVTAGATYSVVVSSPAGEAHLHGVRSGAHVEVRLGTPAASSLSESATMTDPSRPSAAL